MWINKDVKSKRQNRLKSLKKSLALFWILYFLFSKKFCEYLTVENPDYKKEIMTEILKKDIREPIWKVKNCLLELEKDFIELKDRELKDRKVNIEIEIEQLFLKPIMSL